MQQIRKFLDTICMDLDPDPNFSPAPKQVHTRFVTDQAQGYSNNLIPINIPNHQVGHRCTGKIDGYNFLQCPTFNINGQLAWQVDLSDIWDRSSTGGINLLQDMNPTSKSMATSGTTCGVFHGFSKPHGKDICIMGIFSSPGPQRDKFPFNHVIVFVIFFFIIWALIRWHLIRLHFLVLFNDHDAIFICFVQVMWIADNLHGILGKPLSKWT